MSASSKYGRGGGHRINRLVAPPQAPRGMVALRRGPAPGKEKSRTEEVSVKGRGVGMKGSIVGPASAGNNCQEERFQLIPCGGDVFPLHAMAMRLTPGLLEAMKRVEELGEKITIKFSVTQNVIKVGEEEFRFSSAPEPGNVCDIFEEQQRGEDGNGLLVESGPVWRKLSVIRTLSATEKDRVKARSVEAERQQKSRKAIILDPINSVMNNKVTTSADVNGRRIPPAKSKKEPPQKKRMLATTSPVVPPVPALKPKPIPPSAEKPPVSVVTTKLAKTTGVSSPEPPPTSSRISSVQSVIVPPSKTRGTAAEEGGGSAPSKVIPALQKDKDPSSALAATGEAGSTSKTAGVVNLTELRNCLITLLTENPKGMTIKAVEKCLGEAMPNVRVDKKQIEKVIKAIASYHAPGKYMLKEGVEKGFSKPSPGSGSSPETVPMDSPPMPDSPIPMEIAGEALQEAGVNTDIGATSQQEPKKAGGAIRSSTLPIQRVGESAVNRAIRKATEITRVNAERSHPSGNAERSHPSGNDKSRVMVMKSPDHKLEDVSLKESCATQEVGEVDLVIIGREESPAIAHEEQGLETEHITQEVLKLVSPSSLAVNHKKDNSDGSESSSSSASESDSDTDQDSDSDSESGSGSGSGSDSESDGSSSSGSEEENMDEDVDIISDDEDKVGKDVTEASKQKMKSKDAKTALQRQENRAQKQASRLKDHPKKQKPKAADTGMTPHGSEDVDIGDGAEGGEITKGVLHEITEKVGAMDSNIEVEVDVISCDGGTNSPEELGIPSPAGFEKHDNNEMNTTANLSCTEVKDASQVNLPVSMQPKSGSESDHSIEEYETRAENSGVRGARVNPIGDQKDDSCFEAKERRIEAAESVPSPRSKGSTGIKHIETAGSFEIESGNEVGCSGTMFKGGELSDGLLSTKEHSASGGISYKSDNVQRSLLGSPPLPRDGLDQLGPRTYRENKSKGMEFKKKEVESTVKLMKNTVLSESQEKRCDAHKASQGSNKTIELSSRSAKSSEVSLKPPGEVEILVRSSEGMGKVPRLIEEPGFSGKGPEMRETSTLDRAVKVPMRDGDTVERVDLQRRQNRESSLLGKPGKVSGFVGRTKEYDTSTGLREKDANFLGRPGRDTKQSKKPFEKLDGPRRGDLPERTGAAVEVGEKPVRDTESQRRLLRDPESWRKSPKNMESVSRSGFENSDIQGFKTLQKSQIDLSEVKSSVLEVIDVTSTKDKESRGNSELELGELRDIVAGDELRTKDTLRNEAGKWRESSDAAARQPSSKLYTSPGKEKVRNIAKQVVDLRKPSPAAVKKQQPGKKDLPKVEVAIPLRDTVRPIFNIQKLGANQEEKLETGTNRPLESTKIRPTVGDINEKPIEGRSGKRVAEDIGIHEAGKPSKRLAVELPQVSGSFGRGDLDNSLNKAEKVSSLLDTTGKTSAVVDLGKVTSVEGWNQQAAYGGKEMSENGRVAVLKNKGYDVTEKEIVEKRNSTSDAKQKTAGVLVPASKREASGPDLFQSNGKKRFAQTGNGQGQEFFAVYEKRVPELKGPILHYDQYREYQKEYNDKYPVYVLLNEVLESDKEDFESVSRDIGNAKTSEDKNRLGNLYGKVRNDYLQCRKRFKRMQKTFSVLHDELTVIKQRCKEYAVKVAQG